MDNEGRGETRNQIGGGIQYEPVLQGRDFTNITFITNQPTPVPVALAQLPALAVGFTGRETELAQLTELLNPSGATPTVVVSAVAGRAGVGKTALAIQAAHTARDAGWFPGGVLFIDLHGYDDSPVRPGQALDALLRALGIPAERIPPTAEERAGLYRSVLAQINDPVLIIADNASVEVQVQLLLPGPGPHRVIVTSRHTLAGLGARLMDVTVLDPTAGAVLLDVALRAARPSDDRIGGDPDTARQLVKMCGGLPLALRITAAILIADPALTAREMAYQMPNEINRLETLGYDDGGGTRASSAAAAAVELSYQQLDEAAARLFRLLPIDPGPDTSTAAAAALAGWPTKKTLKMIMRLVDAHLVEPAGSGPDRWRMHDLLRLYARQFSDAVFRNDKREQARDRLLGYYLSGADAADDHLRAFGNTRVPSVFADRDGAMAWLDAERPNLVASVMMAASTDRDLIAMSLPLALSEYLYLRRHFDEMLTILVISRDAAQRLGDLKSKAYALTSISVISDEVQQGGEAINAAQEAVAIFRQIDDREGLGRALVNLGVALRSVAQLDEAITACQDAVAIFREIRNRHGEGAALAGLGITLRSVGRFNEAVAACQEAATIIHEAGDGYRESTLLNNLGLALYDAGRFDEAITAYQEAIALSRELGDPHREGMALSNIGLALQKIRRFDEAIAACHDAIALFRKTGDWNSERIALKNLGTYWIAQRTPNR